MEMPGRLAHAHPRMHTHTHKQHTVQWHDVSFDGARWKGSGVKAELKLSAFNTVTARNTEPKWRTTDHIISA